MLESSVDLALKMSLDLGHIYYVRVRSMTLEMSVDPVPSNVCLSLTYGLGD